MKTNPFKMWGPWIGVIFYVVLVFVAENITGYSSNSGFVFNFPTGTGLAVVLISFPGILLDMQLAGDAYEGPIGMFGIMSGIIICFLIGWGIQVLLRKWRVI